MRRVVVAALVATSLTTLAPAATAGAGLGAYSALAEAGIVRIGLYEQAIPIPAEPQVDMGIGFTRANTANGPSSRGLASYLWPGDAVGDGLGVLMGNESLAYPVKTSASYPATETSPAENSVQIKDGSGMSSTADDRTTRATVVGLGLGNGTGGPGDLPEPVAAAATIENLKSQSTVVLEENSITATARSVASGISVLGGLITLDGLDMRSEARSDGVTGKVRGIAKFTGLRVLGQAVDLGDPVNLAGQTSPPPKLPQALADLGITVEYLENQRTTDGAAGALQAEGLTITLDVAPLRDLLQLGGLSDVVSPALVNVDQAGPVLLGLLKLGSKIVITLGDVRTRASAAPAYVVPDVPVAGPVEGPPVPGGPIAPGNPFLPEDAGMPLAPPLAPPAVTVAPASVDLPGLGEVPRWFLLAGLALVALAGWGLRGFGTWVFGGGTCLHGNSLGVPDLRKALSP